PAPRASGCTGMAVHYAGVTSGAKCFKLHYVQPNFFIFILKTSNIPKSIIFSPESI
ncbi:hypothetical protein HAX54_019346, partial [Datura stramonium]|nr:hypothetical protein [Datura stramonium]